jgi:hypothetical protein
MKVLITGVADFIADPVTLAKCNKCKFDPNPVLFPLNYTLRATK